jgi:hypothetical protein
MPPAGISAGCFFNHGLNGKKNRKLYIDKPISNIRYRKLDIRPER